MQVLATSRCRTWYMLVPLMCTPVSGILMQSSHCRRTLHSTEYNTDAPCCLVTINRHHNLLNPAYRLQHEINHYYLFTLLINCQNRIKGGHDIFCGFREQDLYRPDTLGDAQWTKGVEAFDLQMKSINYYYYYYYYYYYIRFMASSP